MTPRAVFQHQTVAGFAGGREAVEASSAVGGHCERSRAGDADHALAAGARRARSTVRSAMLLRVPAGLHEADLLALQAVLDHHHALRLRLVARREVAIAASVSEAGAVAAADCLRRVEIAGSMQRGAGGVHLRTSARRRPMRLSPAAGLHGAGGLVRCWAGGAGRLLVVIHHLAVDGVSWRILCAGPYGGLAGCGGGWPEFAPRGPRFAAGRNGFCRRRGCAVLASFRSGRDAERARAFAG